MFASGQRNGLMGINILVHFNKSNQKLENCVDYKIPFKS